VEAPKEFCFVTKIAGSNNAPHLSYLAIVDAIVPTEWLGVAQSGSRAVFQFAASIDSEGKPRKELP
jgi:hypothetical protein